MYLSNQMMHYLTLMLLGSTVLPTVSNLLPIWMKTPLQSTMIVLSTSTHSTTTKQTNYQAQSLIFKIIMVNGAVDLILALHSTCHSLNIVFNVAIAQIPQSKLSVNIRFKFKATTISGQHPILHLVLVSSPTLASWIICKRNQPWLCN